MYSILLSYWGFKRKFDKSDTNSFPQGTLESTVPSNRKAIPLVFIRLPPHHLVLSYRFLQALCDHAIEWSLFYPIIFYNKTVFGLLNNFLKLFHLHCCLLVLFFPLKYNESLQSRFSQPLQESAHYLIPSGSQ